MITNPQKTSHRYLRKLLVLPVAAIVFILFAFTYRNRPTTGTQEIAIDTAPKTATIIKEVTLPDTSHPLLVINGKEQPGLTISQLEQKVSAADIESINVLKGATATQKYGSKGRNGVIEIITKKTKDIKIKEVTLSDVKSGDDNKIFERAEIDPSFPGGEVAWRKYLERNLNPLVPIQNHAPVNSYTVCIEFVVRKDGNLTDIRPLTNHGLGMEEEVIRLIKKGPAWSPAIQNGHAVNAYKKQFVTFVVDNGEKKFEAELKKTGSTSNEVVIVGFPSDMDTSNKIFEKVEIEPTFPGGEVAWEKYLARNLNSSVAAENNAPAGEYTIYVQFIVHTDGQITDIKALTNHGFGMEQEAMKMIRKGPSWISAMQNGKVVTAYKKQRIDFVVAKGQKIVTP